MKFWQVDSFTDKAFKGNPAAVFISQEDLEEKLKQNIAMEMNLSETAFVALGSKIPTISFFTPNTEVPLCGHATLAAAHILWTQNFIKEPTISLNSKNGLIKISQQGQYYNLDFPTDPCIAKPEYESVIKEIIDTPIIYIGSNDTDCLVVIKDRDYLIKARPSLEKISKLSERGFIMTAQDESQKVDFIYRAFFPKLDIPEDPVTGAANMFLVPYWSQFFKKNKLKAWQASKRGGYLNLELKNDRVLISGQAITIFEGNMINF